jgi:methyl-accepting chemotaxis protein
MNSKAMKTASAEDVPEALKHLHESMIVELNRHLHPGLDRRPNGHAEPVAAAPGAEISAYIGRVQRAANLLHNSARRIRELEDSVYNLKRQFAESSAQLQDANTRCHELEHSLAEERERASRADERALAAEAITHQLHEALANASGNLEALTSTIESAFGSVGDTHASARDAA